MRHNAGNRFPDRLTSLWLGGELAVLPALALAATPEPKTGRISYFAKGRGIGDCGVAGGYAWTGSSFVLTELSMMGECRGIGSDDWITLFRSEVKIAK
jgi:hypothetical protein